MVNAMLYLGRTGCQWRALPHDFAPWGSVWELFRAGAREWASLRASTRPCATPAAQDGSLVAPSAAILDSQSVKTTKKGGLADLTRERRSRGENGISW